MEDEIVKFKDLLLRSYRLLAECTDSSFDGEKWQSSEQIALMAEIADMLNIEVEHRL